MFWERLEVSGNVSKRLEAVPNVRMCFGAFLERMGAFGRLDSVQARPAHIRGLIAHTRRQKLNKS